MVSLLVPPFRLVTLLALGWLLAGGVDAAEGLLGPEAETVPLLNPSFEEGERDGIPTGWDAYKIASASRRRERVQGQGGTALRLVDGDTAEEIGVSQTFPLKPGRYYELSVQARADGAPADNTVFAQLRFLPSNKQVQEPIRVAGAEQSETTVIGEMAPADTTRGVIYLYTLREGTSRLLIDAVTLRVADLRGFDQVTAPKRLVPETVLVRQGQAAAIIVAPASEPWAELARGLTARLKERLGVEIPIRTDREVSEADLRQTTGILLGNVAVNRALLYPYSHSQCYSDGLYPGAGGCEVRTVHDPWGSGRNLLILGASDGAGLQRAIAVLLEGLQSAAADVALPPLCVVELGAACKKALGSVFTRSLDEAWVKAQEQEAERQLRVGIHCGLFNLAQRYGQWYALSQRPEYAKVFVWMLRRALAHYETKPTTYGGPWGMDSDFEIYRVAPLWDVVEECPALSEADRLEVSRILHRWVSELIGKGRPHGQKVRFNHTTFPALGGLYAGQYFERYYNDMVAKQWLRQAHEVFRFQAQTTKPSCDCNSYQWLTLQHTMLYALASGDLTYFENGNLRQLLDYLILSQNPLGEGVAYGDIGSWNAGTAGEPLLRGAYWFRPDAGLAWLLARAGGEADKPVLGGYGVLPSPEQRAPAELTGLVAWPLPRPWYDSFASATPTAAATPFAATVDKIGFRSGYDADAAYLLLDGLNLGGHGHMDGNAVLQWCEQGRIWLTDGDYIKSLPKYHNTLLVLRDGQSARPPAFCELRNAANLPRVGISQTTLRGYAGLDWERSLVWLKGRWFAVLDRVVAQEAGDYSLRAVWQTIGTVQLVGSTLDLEQGGRHARIAMPAGTPCLLHEDADLGSNWRGYPYAGDGSIRVLQGLAGGRLEKGATRELATLLDAAGEQPSTASIERLGDGLYRITDESGSAVLALRGLDGQCQLAAGLSLDADLALLTPDLVAAANLVTPGRGRSDVEQDLTTASARVEASAGVKAGSVPAAAETVAGGVLRVGQESRAVLRRVRAVASATVTIQTGPAAGAAPRQLVRRWSVEDAPAELVLSNNRALAGRVDAGLTLRCLPPPLGANVFGGEAGRNLPENMLDGQLQGVGGATMWDTDQQVTIDLAFAEPVQVSAVEVQAWHAASSSKGNAYGVATLKLLADETPPAALQPLATLTDAEPRPDWGDPVLYRLTGLKHDGKTLRLVLTPRAGRAIYVAEIVVRGDAPWLRRKLVGVPAGTFSAVDLADVDGDGQAEAIAGTSAGAVLCFDAVGKRRWRTEFGAAVRAVVGVAFAGADRGATVVVGGDRDAVCAYGADGKALWTHDIERYKTAGDVRVLFAADLDGKGRQVAVAGSRNWRFHILDGDGTKRWHYESVHASTAGCAVDLDRDGRQELLLGTAYYGWHAANPDGSRRWSYPTLGGPGCEAIAAGDVTGDGLPEVFFGGQDALVQATDASGRALWQANTGDVVTGLAVLDTDADGRGEVLASSLSFNLFCFDGEGRIRWRRDLGSPVRALAVAREGALTHVVLVTQAGGVWLIDPRQGQNLATYELGAGATRLAARGGMVLVADEAGKLTALEAGSADQPKAP